MIFNPSKMDRFLVPVRRASGLDRPGLLSEVNTKLTAEGHAVICGGGGTGKTQLALAFCYKYKTEHPNALVIWIGAETPYLESRLGEVAAQLSITDQTNLSEVIVDWLRLHSKENWILVLDDIGQNMLPKSTKNSLDTLISSTAIFCTLKGDEKTLEKVLITALDHEDAQVRIPDLTPTEGLEVLQQFCPNTPCDEANAEQVLSSLEFSLLACSLAAAYMEDNGVPFEEYLSLLQQRADDSGNPRLSTPVSRALMISLKRLRDERPQAVDICNLMAMLDRQCVVESLLLDDRKCPNTRNFYRSLRRLEGLSLIQKTTEEYYYSMSRLVRDFFVAHLKTEGELEAEQQRIIELLSARYPYGDQGFWTTCRMYNPHAEKAIHFPVQAQNIMTREKLITNMASYHQTRGNFKTAENLYTELLGIYSSLPRLSKKEEHRVVNILLQLAEMLGKRSQFDAAETILKETMDRIKSNLEPGNSNLIRARGLQAWLASWRGQHAESERLWRLCLKDNNEMYYETHVDSLTYQSNIATALIEQEEYDEAEKMLLKTLQGRISVRGNDHPDTIQSQQNLAALYKAQGRYSEAEDLGQKALHTATRVLGSEHPDTLTIVSNLATNLSAQGRFSESEEMQWRLLASRERQFGLDHEQVVLSRINLAITLERLAKYSVAEEQNRLALEAQKRLFPSDTHPTTLNIENTLGVLLMRQGEFRKAEPLLREVLRKRQQTLVACHGDILGAQNNLAGALMKQKKYRESVVLFRETFEAAKEVAGEESAFTLRLMNNLSEAMRQGILEVPEKERQRVFLEALDLQRNSLGGRTKLFGEDHPDVYTSQYNLAHLLHDLGRCSEARKLYAQAAEGLKAKLGESHPMTIDCETNFAICMKD